MSKHTPGRGYQIESLRPERQDGIDLPVYSIGNESGHVAMVAPYYDGLCWSAKYYNVLWSNGKVEKCQSAEAAIAKATQP